ncbi:MAG: ACT domain-containing protein [Armatimonadota bacterium]
MADGIKKVQHFRTTVEDRPGMLAEITKGLADAGVNLLYIGGWPAGGGQATIACVPEDPDTFKSLAAQHGISLEEDTGFLYECGDRVGALCDIAAKLGDAGINIYAVQGLAAGGQCAAILTVRAEDVGKAAQALGV